jgi:hypothetical protein
VTSTWVATADHQPEEADADEVGAYEIEYTCQSVTDCGEEVLRTALPLRRTVIVTYNDAPHCSPHGGNTVTVEASFPYIDQGACFYDGFLGEIASTAQDQLPQITNNLIDANIALTNSTPTTIVSTNVDVDTTVVGEHHVTYKITNPIPDFATWEISSCVRTVNVVDTLVPVISLQHAGHFTQTDIRPDISSADVPFANPAQYLVANPGTRKAVNYDDHTELGGAPYLPSQSVTSYLECTARCESMPTCLYGTYISAGDRAGECWLSATTSKLARRCGMPCNSFIVVDENLDTDTQFRRRRMLVQTNVGVAGEAVPLSWVAPALGMLAVVAIALVAVAM